MCGIAGLVEDPFDERVLVSMSESIRHRGPDDDGIATWPHETVGLASRRLAIIDPGPRGRQPIANETDDVWVVFNGEIYNHAGLRAELESAGHRFRTGTDTEVLVHAYEQWGDDHVDRLRGMFAYAIYDRRHRRPGPGRLLLVRDRLGIKPLHYAETGRSFAFASEIKALLLWPRLDRDVHPCSVSDYLTYGYVPAPASIFRGIRKLEPGHVLIRDTDGVRTRRYWTAPDPEPGPDVDDAIEALRARLEDAVAANLVSDVPVGAFLSGGVDSSTVAALMMRSASEPIRTFTVGFDVAARSEADDARAVADAIGSVHHADHVSFGSMRDALPRVLSVYDEPFADSSAIPTLHLAAAAATHVKTVQSGDGGDEVFAGYRWYSWWLRRSRLDGLSGRATLFGALHAMWPATLTGKRLVASVAAAPFERYALLREVFTSEERRALLGPDVFRSVTDLDPYWALRRHWRDDLDPMTRMQRADLGTYLPDDILTKVDRASMAVSLEVRPPLLDHELVALSFGLPGEVRSPGGALKGLFKEAVSPMVPASVLDKPKQGFSAPLGHWMRDDPSLRADVAGFRDPTGLLAPAPPPASVLGSPSKLWALAVLQRFLAGQVS